MLPGRELANKECNSYWMDLLPWHYDGVVAIVVSRAIMPCSEDVQTGAPTAGQPGFHGFLCSGLLHHSIVGDPMSMVELQRPEAPSAPYLIYPSWRASDTWRHQLFLCHGGRATKPRPGVKGTKCCQWLNKLGRRSVYRPVSILLVSAIERTWSKSRRQWPRTGCFRSLTWICRKVTPVVDAAVPTRTDTR